MGLSNEKPRQRGIGPGPSSRHVAENVKALRKAAGVDLKGLADRLKKLGRPMSTSSINRIETADRRVDADDIFAFAMALNASPSDLLKPNPAGETPSAVPEVFLWEEVSAWIGGQIPLTPEGLITYWEAVEAETEQFLSRLKMGLEKMDSGQWSGKARQSYETKIQAQEGRLELARERQALADSFDLEKNQYEMASELLANDDE